MRELADYLRSLGAWWILVVVVTAGAVVAGAAIVFPLDSVYETSAVVGPELEAQSANDRVDFIRNMQAAAETNEVLDAVAVASGLTPQEISEGLRVERIERSNLVLVSFESNESNPDAARAVVLTVPDEAVLFLRTTRIQEALSRLDQAQEEADAATAAVVAAEDAVANAIEVNGDIRPDLAFDALQTELAALRIRRANTDAAEDAVLAEQLSDAIADLESQLPALSVRANTFTELVAERNRMIRAEDDASDELATAQGLYDQALVLPSVFLQQVAEEVSQVWLGQRRVAAIGVAVFVLMVALLVSVSMLTGRVEQPVAGIEDTIGKIAVGGRDT